MTTKTFTTVDTEWADRSGHAVTVLGEIDPTTYDRDEVGPMFRIQFADGIQADAFGDELS